MRELPRGTVEKPLRIVGLMSGTSADGIDAALVEVWEEAQRREPTARRGTEGRGSAAAWPRVRLLAVHAEPHGGELRRLILQACDPAASGVDLLCHLHAALGEAFAGAVHRLLAGAKVPARTVSLIGSHGQTVYHNPIRRRSAGPRTSPQAHGQRSFLPSSLQLGDPSVIAQRTGITTVGNFRPADMAVGGQGAPLTPLPHAWLFGERSAARLVLNLGGIANLTLVLPPPGRRLAPVPALAFDTGPANMVLDGLVQRFSAGRRRCDRNGRLAARGQVHEALLNELLRHPFFRRKPPRSTGREEFGGAFVARLCERGAALGLYEADLLATACELTAASVAGAIRRFVLPASPVEQLILCGGGVRNAHLVERLTALLPGLRLEGSSRYGVPEQAVEAASFALLAYATARGRPGNVPAATGARQAVVLGVVAPVPRRGE